MGFLIFSCNEEPRGFSTTWCQRWDVGSFQVSKLSCGGQSALQCCLTAKAAAGGNGRSGRFGDLGFEY